MGVIRARFRMDLPEGIWVEEVSTAFPDATLVLLTGVPKGERALEMGEVRADDPEPITAAIQAHSDIFAYEQIHTGSSRVLVQYEVEEKGLYELLWESSLPPEFPITAQNGAIEFDLTATREQFEAFGARLDDLDRQYELLTLVHTDDQEGLLTDRQRECLAVAQRRGYLAVPRECTLAELADALDVDKSTASETIRRGVARVVSQFLVTRD